MTFIVFASWFFALKRRERTEILNCFVACQRLENELIPGTTLTYLHWVFSIVFSAVFSVKIVWALFLRSYSSYPLPVYIYLCSIFRVLNTSANVKGVTKLFLLSNDTSEGKFHLTLTTISEGRELTSSETRGCLKF